MDRVAAKAGVSKATMYRHFGQKLALFHAVVTDICEEARTQLECGLQPARGDVEEALRALGEGVLRVSISPSFLALQGAATPGGGAAGL
jgi:AcrR family transcriptional regulator